MKTARTVLYCRRAENGASWHCQYVRADMVLRAPWFIPDYPQKRCLCERRHSIEAERAWGNVEQPFAHTGGYFQDQYRSGLRWRPDAMNHEGTTQSHQAEAREELGSLSGNAVENAADRLDIKEETTNMEPSMHHVDEQIDAATFGEAEEMLPTKVEVCGEIMKMENDAVYIGSADGQGLSMDNERWKDSADHENADIRGTMDEKTERWTAVIQEALSNDMGETAAEPTKPNAEPICNDTEIVDLMDCNDDCGDEVPPEEPHKNDPAVRGLLYFMKWWYLRRVDVSVQGKMLTGIPAFFEEDTLRIFGDQHSYIVPIRNIDYIRTPDGLRSIEAHFDDRLL